MICVSMLGPMVGMFLVSVTASMVGVIMTMVIIIINREIALMLGVTLLT